jgi:hypothetical protein
VRQVVARGGKAVVEQVPAPVVAPGTVLVRTALSCVSIGTESASGGRGPRRAVAP